MSSPLFAAPTALSGMKEGLPQPAVTAVSHCQGWVWAGTDKGLAVRRPGQAKFGALRGVTEKITAIASQGKTAWVGTRQGLYLVNGETDAWQDCRTRAGVPSGAVHTLVADLGGNVWLGSENGLAVLKAGRTEWRSLALPQDVPGPVRAIAPSGSFCYVGAATPDLLVLDQDSGRWLRRTAPGLEVGITAISVYGSSVYAGTDGQGLWQFDWSTNLWKKIHPANETGNVFLFSAAANGEQAWFGSFDGLLQVQQPSAQVAPADSRLNLPAGAVNCLEIGNGQLLAGTEMGLAETPLEKPQVAWEPARSVVLAPRGEIEFSGRAVSSAAIQKLSADFAIRPLPDTWFANNLTVQGPDSEGRVRGRWQLENLPSPSDFYLLRLTVLDQRGASNTALTQIIIAPGAPALRFDAVDGMLNEGLQTLSGAFDTPFASEILVEPGDVKARIDRTEGKFFATVKLLSGSNAIQARLTDWFGRQTLASMDVKAAANIAPETSVRVETSATGEETLTLSEVLLFDTASVVIKSSGFSALEKVADYLNRDERLQATIVGHTDNVPIKTQLYPNNLELSKGRAKAVFDYFVKEKNIKPQRLMIKGLGETKPIAGNKTAEGRAKNRRVEIIVNKAE